MDAWLIIFGAALALGGGMIVDLWRALREGRAAAIAIFTELGTYEYVFGLWFSRAHDDLGLTHAGRTTSGALVANLSARELQELAARRTPSIRLRPFPKESPRGAWESQGPKLAQIATPGQISAVALWYTFAGAGLAEEQSSGSLIERNREASDRCGGLMDLTFLAWVWRSVRAWRPWHMRRHAEDE